MSSRAIRELQTFTPILSVVGSDLEGIKARALAAAGTLFSPAANSTQSMTPAARFAWAIPDLETRRLKKGWSIRWPTFASGKSDATRFPSFTCRRKPPHPTGGASMDWALGLSRCLKMEPSRPHIAGNAISVAILR
ncbi:MAG: hypothetical protein R3F19_02855 [Verrucomicrobiales bacterium]